MQKVCIFILLHAVFEIGLSSQAHGYKPRAANSLSRPAFAEIEQTVILDLLRGVAEEILDYLEVHDGPLRSIFDRLNDFIQNEFDPEGSQTTQLNFVIGILKELLDYARSAVPDEAVEDQSDVDSYYWSGKQFKVDRQRK